MIEWKGIMGIPFLKKSRFTGSDGRLRYVLEKRSCADVAGRGPAGAPGIGLEEIPDSGDCLAAVFWYGIYGSAATPDEEKTTAYFPFNEAGLEAAREWLNRQL